MIMESDEIINGLMLIYQEVLISLSKFDSAKESVCHFLDGSFLERYVSNEEKTLIWKTDLTIALAKANKMIDKVLPWIIRYFSQTKTASIDLNRYKLEAFLMTSENNKVNQVI